jgi:protein-S-isoprenylcysteine O-methyltransferase Ste14
LNPAEQVQKTEFDKIETILIIIMSFAYIGLFFSGFISSNPSYNQVIGILGWIIWVFGLVLAFSPNIVLKKRGGVPKGKSYTQTTKLVTDGIYGLIRHPQYTGGLIISFSMCFIVQTLLTCLLTVITILCTYLSMVFEEKRLVIKFGSQYDNYQTEVPRANLLLGLIRYLRN